MDGVEVAVGSAAVLVGDGAGNGGVVVGAVAVARAVDGGAVAGVAPGPPVLQAVRMTIRNRRVQRLVMVSPQRIDPDGRRGPGLGIPHL